MHFQPHSRRHHAGVPFPGGALSAAVVGLRRFGRLLFGAAALRGRVLALALRFADHVAAIRE